jgi:hypothetical protein
MADRNLIEGKIGLLGSEGRPAEAAGCSQVAINKAQKRVVGGRASAETAVALEKATTARSFGGGYVPIFGIRHQTLVWPTDNVM